MKLFDMFKSKKENQTQSAYTITSKSFSIPTMNREEITREPGIMVLGTGCTKCKELTVITEKAVSEIELTEKVNHVRDLATIAQYGVMTTPALVIDGAVVSTGRVLKIEEVKYLIQTNRNI